MKLLTFTLLSLFLISAIANVAFGSVLGFRDWKQEKVSSATGRVNSHRIQIAKLKLEGEMDSVKSLEKDLSQEVWNLDVANDLSVTDYFVLYLAQQPSPSRFHEAATKLSSAEIAELMEAYAKAIGAAPFEKTGEKLPTAASLQPRSK